MMDSEGPSAIGLKAFRRCQSSTGALASAKAEPLLTPGMTMGSGMSGGEGAERVSRIAVAPILIHVEHPFDAPAVIEHAEALGPEGFLELHFHGAAILECGEHAVGILDGFGVDREINA